MITAITNLIGDHRYAAVVRKDRGRHEVRNHHRFSEASQERLERMGKVHTLKCGVKFIEEVVTK